MDTCPTCRDYLVQLRRASARGDNENFQAVKVLYIEHIQQAHARTSSVQKVDRERLRQAFGRLGEE